MHRAECTGVLTPLQAEGNMTLHGASRRGNPGVVQALVDSKADLEARDEVTMQVYKAHLIPHPLRMLQSQLRVMACEWHVVCVSTCPAVHGGVR